MVIHDRDLRGARVGPEKYDAPLIVDPDGVEPRENAFEEFETVAGWNGEIVCQK